jgi:DNA-binding MarR family transcriptional regulator
MSLAARIPNKTQKRKELEDRALLSARALVDRMRTLYRELERLTGAPIAQHRVLSCIATEPGLAAARLAAKLGMQPPAVSHVLKSLTERGWIERRRTEDDQRSVSIHVTVQGQHILNASAGSAVGTLQRAVTGLENRDLSELANGLEALLAKLPEKEIDASIDRKRQAQIRKR